MTYHTVHMDGSGELRPMDLDTWQYRGDACAVCGKHDNGHNLQRIGTLVGPGNDIAVCRDCRSSV